MRTDALAAAAPRAAAKAPSHVHVIRSIARREVGIASRGRMVRLFFLGSLLPPLVMGIILVVRVMAKKAVGVDLGWDPVLRMLMIQAMPVFLLSLGLGTPLVARDRAEDVLYLYAVRPVLPWHYTWGKMLAVVIPAFLLLFLPGVLLAVLRQGVMGDKIGTDESILLVLKVGLAASFIAMGYAGVSVGASAATRRARWALLIAFAVFVVPDAIVEGIWQEDAYGAGPANAAVELLRALFGEREPVRGLVGAAVLAVYGALGILVTLRGVRREMIP